MRDVSGGNGTDSDGCQRGLHLRDNRETEMLRILLRGNTLVDLGGSCQSLLVTFSRKVDQVAALSIFLVGFEQAIAMR